jgi:hypothetical protein
MENAWISVDSAAREPLSIDFNGFAVYVRKGSVVMVEEFLQKIDGKQPPIFCRSVARSGEDSGDGTR